MATSKCLSTTDEPLTLTRNVPPPLPLYCEIGLCFSHIICLQYRYLYTLQWYTKRTGNSLQG